MSEWWIELATGAATGALIGYGTNWLAIKMLFKPRHKKWYTLGWQGVIPARQAALATQIGTLIENEFFTPESIAHQLEAETVRATVSNAVAGEIERIVETEWPSTADMLAEKPALKTATEQILDDVIATRLAALVTSAAAREWAEQWARQALDAVAARSPQQLLGAAGRHAATDAFCVQVENLLRGEGDRAIADLIDTMIARAATDESPLADMVPALRPLPAGNLSRRLAPEAATMLADWVSSSATLDWLEALIHREVPKIARQIIAKQDVIPSFLTGLLSGLDQKLAQIAAREMRANVPEITKQLRAGEFDDHLQRLIRDAAVDLGHRPISEVVGWLSDDIRASLPHDMARRLVRELLVGTTDPTNPTTITAAESATTTPDSGEIFALRPLVDRAVHAVWDRPLHEFIGESGGHTETLAAHGVEQVFAYLAQPLAMAGAVEVAQREAKALLRLRIGVPRMWLPERLIREAKRLGRELLLGLLRDRLPQLGRQVGIRAMIERDLRDRDPEELEALVQNVVSREFQAIQVLGGVLGVIIGTVPPLIRLISG